MRDLSEFILSVIVSILSISIFMFILIAPFLFTDSEFIAFPVFLFISLPLALYFLAGSPNYNVPGGKN